MKKRLLYIFTFLFALATQSAMSQDVYFKAKLGPALKDTVEMRIGEQVKFTVELGNIASGNSVELLIPDKLANDVEILDRKDFTTTDSKGLNTYRSECLITPFIDGDLEIPAIYAKVNDDNSSYYTNRTYLVVNSVPIDTANLKNIKGFNPIWDVDKMKWEDYRDTVYLSFLLVVFALLLAWIIVRFIKNKPLIRIVRVKPKKPSHFTALEKMEEIKGDKSLYGETGVKEYYTRLTDTLREYMQNRYEFNATDMTTAEIIDNLLRYNDKDAIREVKELLDVADLVKFAKFQPTQYENDTNLRNAVEFVNATKNVEEENRKTVEKKIVNKRSVNQKHWQIAAIAAVASILIAIITLLVMDVNNLLG